jgi:ketosteroid isomerase-like protein
VAQGWKAAFPDLQGNIFTRADCGNTAVLEINWTGTNRGPIEMASGTLPATGKSVEFDDAQIHVVENGQITEFRNYGDFLTMLGQLGILPG